VSERKNRWPWHEEVRHLVVATSRIGRDCCRGHDGRRRRQDSEPELDGDRVVDAVVVVAADATFGMTTNRNFFGIVAHEILTGHRLFLLKSIL